MEMTAVVAAVIAAILSFIAALGAWRGQDTAPASDARVEELISALKGGLISELGRVRVSVESGIRDAADATRATQQELHEQTSMISEALHVELERQFMVLRRTLSSLLEERFGMLVTGIDRQFGLAQDDLRASLGDQLTRLRDLKDNYEASLAQLKAQVAQHASRSIEAIMAQTDRIRSDLAGVDLRAEAPRGAVGSASEIHAMRVELATLTARLDETLQQIDRLTEATERLVGSIHGAS